MLTPGLYTHAKKSYGPERLSIVLAGDEYAIRADRTGVARRVADLEKPPRGKTGILCLTTRFYKDGLRTRLSDTENLRELCAAAPEILRLATTVSIKAAELRADQIAGFEWEASYIVTHFKPADLAPAPDDLFERIDQRFDRQRMAARFQELGLSCHVNGLGRIQLELDNAQAHHILGALNDQETP